ncbi:MAG: hypothetical protein ACYTEQ_30225, partial [Planctomycetota bacterium]
ESGNVTTLTLGGQSPKFDWSDGNIATANIYEGKVDGSTPSAVGREFTVLRVHPNGSVDLSDDLQNNTVAEGGYIEYLGGEVKFGLGQKLLPIP